MSKPTVSDRVREIALLMSKNEWNDATRDRLRTEWRVSECTMRTQAAEASRRCGEAWDHGVIRQKLVDTLDAATEMAKSEPRNKAAAAMALAKIVETYSRVTSHGEEAPRQHARIVIGSDARSAVLDAIWGPLPDDSVQIKGSGGVILLPPEDVIDGMNEYPRPQPPLPQLPPAKYDGKELLESIFGPPKDLH